MSYIRVSGTGIWLSALVMRRWDASASGMAAYVEDGYGAFCQPKFECGFVRCWYLGCVVQSRTSVISLYHNPGQDDQIYECLLTAMAAMQAVDVRAYFLFMGDLNGHQQEWSGSTTTNRHGVAALDFATVSGYGQLVNGPTHARGGTLDLMTDVTDLVRVADIAPLGSYDHSSLSVAILTCAVSRRAHLKHRINWTAVCDAIGELPWRSIWSADNPVERLNVHLSLLVVHFIPTKVIRVRNKDKSWFNDDCWCAFDRVPTSPHTNIR